MCKGYSAADDALMGEEADAINIRKEEIVVDPI